MNALRESSEASEMILPLIEAISILNDRRLNEGCDCWNAKRALETAQLIWKRLAQGRQLDEYQVSVLVEQIDDVLCCARQHFQPLPIVDWVHRTVDDLYYQSLNSENIAGSAKVASANVPDVRVVRRLTSAAAWVLPPGNRDRYRAEFHSELYELAVAGTSLWGQVAYALRLVDRAFVLRAELRSSTATRVRS